MTARERMSRRQSASSSRPPPKPVFFLDKNLGRYDVAEALRNAGYVAEILTDHFEHDTPDTLWAPEVGRRGWIIVTKDNRVRRRPLELRALWSANVPAFVLRSGDTTGPQNAQAILAAMPTIHELINRKPWPFIATISATGAVHLLLVAGDMLKRL